MDQNTIKAVQDALAPLAQKLGEGSAHMYEVYGRQILQEGISEAIMLGVMFISLIISAVYLNNLWRRWRSGNLHEYSEQVIASMAITYAIVAFFFVAYCVGSLVDIITKISNPEYHAIQRVIDSVKGGR